MHAGSCPENTLPSFAAALRLGVTTLELDVGITRDGVAVISHDPTLNPDITRGPDGAFLSGRGPAIHTLDYAALARYDVGRIRPGTAYARTFPEQQPVDGARIPRLSDLFEMVRKTGNESVRFAIETKLSPQQPELTATPETFTRIVLQDIDKAGLAGRCAIQSFDWRTLQRVQREAPSIATVYLTSGRTEKEDASAWTAGLKLRDHGSMPKMVKAAGGAIWSAHFNSLSAARVKEAQALGLQVLTWTVNEPDDIRRMLDLAVDGIITDYPDRVRTEMQARGMPLPPPVDVPR